MKFHSGFARALADHGIDTIFGALGDGNLFLMDSFDQLENHRFVSMCHEAGAVLAAHGYFATSGRLGVATVTHGPGLTNTVTALVEAVRDRAPLLVIAGDTDIVDPENPQNIGQEEIVRSTGARFAQVRSPGTVFEDVAQAVSRAQVERMPIVLNVPAALQWQDVEYASYRSGSQLTQVVRPDPEVLDRAVGILASARRPLVLAGRGAATARASLLRLAERLGAPVATTLRGKNLFDGHPHDLGVFGTFSHPLALEVIAESDCVIAFGASLNKFTTAERSLTRGRQVIQVDRDQVSIGRFSPVSAGIVGDAAVVADLIVQWLDEAEVPASKFAADRVAGRQNELPSASGDDRDRGGAVDFRTAVDRVEQAFPKDRTLVLDAGRWWLNAVTRLRVPEPQAYVHTLNFGSIGLGMGKAVGAWFGAPARPVLMVVGDGGFMLGGLSEFSSAVRHGVDVTVVVLNDGAYGAEHIQLRNRAMDPSISLFDWPDFGPVATALGGSGVTVRSVAELDAALKAIADRDRPALIDIKVDPDNPALLPH